MKSLIFAVALMLQITDVAAAIVPPREVQSLLRPILDLCVEAEESQGEHQNVLHRVTVRGKRMLPLLLKYRNAHVIFSQRKYPSSILLAYDVKMEFFENAIVSVTPGKVFDEDGQRFMTKPIKQNDRPDLR